MKIDVDSSSLISSADWTPGQGGPGRLVIALKSGLTRTYTYIVANEVGQGFADAESKGAYFAQVLRKHPAVMS